MKRMTLATICGGDVQRKVDKALLEVAENIMDPATSDTAKRSVTVKITLQPFEGLAGEIITAVEVSKKLAPENGNATRLHVERDRFTDEIVIREMADGQVYGQLGFEDYGVDMETGEVIEDTKVISMEGM